MDHIHRTILDGRVIFHEEVARDGAQGKSLLNGRQRAGIARAHSALMGPQSYNNLVFMAGFPSAGKDEFEAVRQVVDEVESCYLGAAGRLIHEDVIGLVRAMEGARYGRIVLILPISAAVTGALMKTSPDQALALALDAVRLARDCGAKAGLEVDVAMLDAARADYRFVADAAVQLTEAGASTIIICDTVGNMYPKEASAFFCELQTRAAGGAAFVVHMHNDLGFGLANTVLALDAGIRGVTSSWLGLGERSGMPATEQLLFVLGHEPEQLGTRFGAGGIWTSPPDLAAILPLALEIGGYVGFDRRTTDPIIGTGVNTISTGTPFTDPKLFSPFDAEAVLGVPQTVLLTALASRAIVEDVSARLGYVLDSDQLGQALNWVKARAHELNRAIVPESDFQAWLAANVATARAPRYA